MKGKELKQLFCKRCSLPVDVIEDMGNPFEEESQDLLVLDTKEIADPAVVKTVRSAKSVGQDQFDAFTKECLLDRTKSIYAATSYHCCIQSIQRKATVELSEV